MQLLPAALAVTAVFRGGPLALAEHRQPSTVDNQMQPLDLRRAPKCDVEVLTTTGQRRVIGRRQVKAHQSEQ